MNSRKAILNQSPIVLNSDNNTSVYSARRLGHDLRQRHAATLDPPPPSLIDTPTLSENADSTSKTTGPRTLRWLLLLALSAAAGYFYFDTSATTTKLESERVQTYTNSVPTKPDPIVTSPTHDAQPNPLVATLTAEYQTTLQTLRDLQKEIQELKRERASARAIVSDHEAVESEKIATVTDEMIRMRETLDILQHNLEAKANEATQLRADIEKVASAHQDATRAQIQSLLEMEDARHRQEHATIIPPKPVETPAESVVDKQEDIFNAACQAVGGRIILSETSRSLQVNPIMSKMGKVLSNLVPNQRYQPVLEQELPGPNVVLDHQEIRGPGDSFCVEGDQLKLSILLGAPVYGKSIEIEHVRPSLDRHPHFAPDHVRISTYASKKDEFGLPFAAQEIETISTELDFSNKWKVQLKLNARDEQIKQVMMTFTRRDSQSHMCVYRVRVMAGLKPETII